jgi:DNA-binding response OmpR family regulator
MLQLVTTGCDPELRHQSREKTMMYSKMNLEEPKREHFGREAGASRSLSILVVEDDFALETVLKRAISRSEPEARLTWVGTGTQAFDKLRDVRSGRIPPYSLIISDLLLPNLELGTHVWRYSQRNMAKIPFVMMSSIRSDAYLRMFLASEDPPPFLRKPFIFEDLIHFMKFALSVPNPAHTGN